MTKTSPETIVRSQRRDDERAVRPLKIVVTGPFSAGKTTFIKSVSEVTVLGTERDVSDDTRRTKGHTTVAMDFGRITLDGDLSLYLFGTPGQRRFEMMWEILAEGMIGFVLLVHAGDDRSIEEASLILRTFCRYADVPYVVGVSHLDEVDEPEEEVLDKVRRALDAPERVAVERCDPREKEDVKGLMLHVLFEVLHRLERAEAAG